MSQQASTISGHWTPPPATPWTRDKTTMKERRTTGTDHSGTGHPRQTGDMSTGKNSIDTTVQ